MEVFGMTLYNIEMENGKRLAVEVTIDKAIATLMGLRDSFAVTSAIVTGLDTDTYEVKNAIEVHFSNDPKEYFQIGWYGEKVLIPRRVRFSTLDMVSLIHDMLRQPEGKLFL